MIKDKLCDARQICKIKFLHHIDQAAMPNLITACQSIDITNQLIRLPYVSADNAYQRLINNASLGKFEYRQVETFFVNAGSVCTKPSPTNINNMGCTGEKTHQISA